MNCCILEAKILPVEVTSHREYRRRLFAKGLEEAGAKASVKEQLGENKELISSWPGLCVAFDGSSVRKPSRSDPIFKIDTWDVLEWENKHPLAFGDYLAFQGAEAVWDSSQVKLETQMREDKEVKRVRPCKLEEGDEQSLAMSNSLLAMSGLPGMMQVEDEGSAMGNEASGMGMEFNEEEEDEFDCLVFDPGCISFEPGYVSFDGKGSRMLDAWPPRSELPSKMDVDMEEEQEDADITWTTPHEYHREWNDLWSDCFGSFEDISRVPSMRFTKKAPSDYSAVPMSTLQIFSVKLAAIREGLKLPLDVFGTVTTRDAIDHNRNIIFCRERDNCQTLTKEDPYLVLTGPSRALMITVSSPVIVQVELKVKGNTESEDRDLSHIVAPVPCGNRLYSLLHSQDLTTKLSTLKFTLGHIVCSVEATIFVRVIQGSWPDDLRGKFGAFTTGYKSEADLNQERINLLDSGGDRITYSGNNGEIKLSRCVVSVEAAGRLNIVVEALKGNDKVIERRRSFKAARYGAERYKYKMGFCELLVRVAWSLLSDTPVLEGDPV